MDNGLEDLWTRKNPDSPEFIRYNKSRIDRVYTDIKIANNNKINHIMVSFTGHYNAISIDRLSSKTKIGIDSWKRFTKIILLCKPQLQRLLILLKT